MLKYTPQPPHPISEEGLKFLASLSERERKLHEMMSAPCAARGLGSSYFVERTHAFRKWKSDVVGHNVTTLANNAKGLL